MNPFKNGKRRLLEIMLMTGQYRLLAIAISSSVALTWMIVSAMSIVFHGRVAYDYLITGLVCAFCVSFMVCSFLVYFLGRYRQAEERFRFLYENARDGIVSVDDKGRIRFANEAAAFNLGYNLDEFMSLCIMDIEAQEDMAEFERHYADMLKGEHLLFETRHKRKDGSLADTEVSLCLATIDGRPITYSIWRDITERRLLEDALRKKTDELNGTLEELKVSHAHLETRVAERTREVETALKQKEALLGEVHHRVKNNLQVIAGLTYLQSRRIKDPAAILLYREIQDRIMAMALIHERLYRSGDTEWVDAKDYLTSLAQSLLRTYGVDQGRVEFSIMSDGMRLRIDDAVPIGLIANEILSNSIKHAFPDDRPGKIAIECGRDAAGQSLLVLQDDGIGMPQAGEWNKDDTLGVALIERLTSQLDGALKRTGPPGTVYHIAFETAK